jgi:predicted signal transduction protein with EAL and GGDEF domain
MRTDDNLDSRRHGNANRQLQSSSRAAAIVSHFLLAAIGVSAVIACVFISLVIINIQNKTLEWNTTWTDRVNQLVALRSRVADLGLQADAILKKFSPEGLNQLNTTYADLDAGLSALQLDMSNNDNLMDRAMKTQVNARINNIVLSTAMLRNNAVRGLSGKGENGPIPVSQTDLDHQELLIQNAISTTTTYIRSEQIAQQKQSVISARYWISWQYVVCGIAIPFMFALVLLSVRMSLRLQRTLKEREQVLEELHVYQRELQIAARTDKLTGLPNRTAMVDYIQSAIARERRHPEFCFAVLFLDIDRFKSVNDCLGHEAGDLLLCEIASRLRLSLREEDMVAVAKPVDDAPIAQQKYGEVMRLGGDEFVVLLDALQTPADACVVADRILAKLAAPFLIQGMPIYPTASIGIVTSKTPNPSVSDLLRNADIAMYEAKLAGRGRSVVFDENMRKRVKRRIILESELRVAAEKGELLLHYQPLICLRNNEVSSYEALIRWNHPQYGMISPMEFIPIAEESGLIIPIGKWVLRESCRQLAQWRSMHGGTAKFPRINVNVSRNQLLLSDFSSTITQILDEFKIEPSSLYLEITEGALMRDREEGGRVLRSLNEVGVKIALDDFGTGYSSLSWLNEFPVHEIKIDRSFVANMMHGQDCLAMVQAIISLTQKLGLSVVAEGIETIDQLFVLQSINCQLGQGYLFAKPLPPEEVPYFSRQSPSNVLPAELRTKYSPFPPSSLIIR